jgi:tetratricopeptide (TPR) repeat protein
MGLYDWALEEFERALKFDSKYQIAKRSLNFYRELKKTHNDESKELERKVSLAQDGRERAKAYFESAKSFYYTQGYVRAIRYLKKTLALDPQFSEKMSLYNLLGSS